MSKMLFVYGTLKRGFLRNEILNGCNFLSEAITTPKYRMYSIHGNFPALVYGDKAIKGELYEIPDSLVPYLDRIEGVPSLYDRATIELSSHPDVECIGYIFQLPVTHYQECGDCWK